MLRVCQGWGCGVIGGTKCGPAGSQRNFAKAGYLVYYSSNDGNKGQCRVGLQPVSKPSPELSASRLLKAALNLRGRAKAASFVLTYASTEAQDGSTLDDPPMLVLMEANPRLGGKGRGGFGSKDNGVRGANG